jgi:hypothetical protein
LLLEAAPTYLRAAKLWLQRRGDIINATGVIDDKAESRASYDSVQRQELPLQRSNMSEFTLAAVFPGVNWRDTRACDWHG